MCGVWAHTLTLLSLRREESVHTHTPTTYVVGGVCVVCVLTHSPLLRERRGEYTHSLTLRVRLSLIRVRGVCTGLPPVALHGPWSHRQVATTRIS